MKAVGYILVCSKCHRLGLRPELVTKSTNAWTRTFDFAGGFIGWKPYEPPSPGSEDDCLDFMWRALKGGASDVEAWREWNRYLKALAIQSDEGRVAEIIAIQDRSVKS
jgi:hypothetical protein